MIVGVNGMMIRVWVKEMAARPHDPRCQIDMNLVVGMGSFAAEVMELAMMLLRWMS